MSFKATSLSVLLVAIALQAAGDVSPLLAQKSTPPAAAAAPAPKADAPPISVPVVVYDKKGDLVQNLTKDNLTLQVDGKPQEIKSFNPDTDLPLTLGLLVDTGMSQRDALDEERTASSAFFDEMLKGPDDRDKAFVVQFSKQVDLLQDTTGSKAKLQAALKQLETTAPSGGSGVTAAPTSTDPKDKSGRARTAQKSLYDTIFLSSDELMSKQKGRKVLVLISDGVDSGSKESVTSSIEAAQRAGAVIYVVYFKGKEPNLDRGFHTGDPDDGSGYPGGGYPGGYPGPYPGGYPSGRGPRPQGIPLPDGKKILEHIATQTGGRLFEVSKKDQVADIYKQIGEEVHAQYRLTFAPDDRAASDGYHKIILTVTKSNPKDFYLQTTEGYYNGD